MFKFSSILPFTSSVFFFYMLSTILLFHISKLLFRNRIKYSWLVGFTSFAYLLLLFPQPIQLVAVLIYYYSIYFIFGRKIKYKKLLLPIILLSLPMLFMKFLGFIPDINFLSKQSDLFNLIFQITGVSYITFKVIQLYIDEKDKEKEL